MVDYIKLLFSLRLHRHINLFWKPNCQMDDYIIIMFIFISTRILNFAFKSKLVGHLWTSFQIYFMFSSLTRGIIIDYEPNRICFFKCVVVNKISSNYLYPCLEATRIIGIKIPLIGYESYLTKANTA
jgi:hypothetical protein